MSMTAIADCMWFALPGGKHCGQAAADPVNSRTAEFFRRRLP